MNHEDIRDDLEKVLNYRFKQPRLLYQALLHRSYVYENPHLEQSDNETLEFLGDAVLNLAISHLLFERFPAYKEGDLSRLRSSIVNERELAKLANQMNLGKYLFLGKGEDFTGGRQKPSLLADSLEALLGAVYLDSDLAVALNIIKRLFSEYFAVDDLEHPLRALDKDYKTQLQEFTQAAFKKTPTYLLEKEEGPDHDKTFYMRVLLDEQVLACGMGKSKKEAQQLAAERALEVLRSGSMEQADQ